MIHSRMFFEQNGVMIEDSSTGSVCANLGAYFIHHNQYPLNKTIHQGDDMDRSNRLILAVDDKQNICVGGKVVKVGWGEFLVPWVVFVSAKYLAKAGKNRKICYLQRHY